MPNRKSPLVLLCVLLMILFTATVGVAQSQATTGNIEGRVTDPNGAAVPGVNVTATNQDTAFVKTVTSDTDGIYLITFLPRASTALPLQAARVSPQPNTEM